MKRILAPLLLFGITVSLHARNADTLRFVYVLENPKYFGTDKAKSWFELEGLKDTTVQKLINEKLRQAFFEFTNFESETDGASMRPNKRTPRGFTDYYYWNGQTFGNGWIRFKNSDSILRLTSASGYYGSGARVGGFYQEILPGKLAWLSIATTRFLNDGVETGRTIDLAFDLRTGLEVPASYRVRLDPAKRDSLDSTLFAIAEQSLNDNETFRDGKIISRDSMNDTIVVYMPQLIRWMRGEKDIYATTICCHYNGIAVSVHDGKEYQTRPQACLSFDEAVSFFLEEDWIKVREH